MKQQPPRQIFEKLVNKNAIKRKIGGPPWQYFLKPLTLPPLGIWAKTSRTSSPGFSTRVHLWSKGCVKHSFKAIFNSNRFCIKSHLLSKLFSKRHQIRANPQKRYLYNLYKKTYRRNWTPLWQILQLQISWYLEKIRFYLLCYID